MYPGLIARGLGGLDVVDLGCGFGADTRQMIVDGATPTRVRGLDVSSKFLELGCQLFGDNHLLGHTFCQCDLLVEDNCLSSKNSDS